MRLPVCFVFIFFISLNCFCQETGNTDVSNVSKVTFVNPGVSYEQRIGKNQTLYGQLFMNTSLSSSYSSSLGSDFHLYFDPAATIQYRYYYNGKRRDAKGRRTEMNSMNFITAVFETDVSKRPFFTTLVETRYRPISSLGIAWGLQRNYQKRFSFDFYIGLGYAFSKSISQYSPQVIRNNYGMFTLMSQLNIGLWLNRKK